jgi:hypothetical protein
MFGDAMCVVAGYLEPRELLNLSLACRSIRADITDSVKRACLQRAVEKYTARVDIFPGPKFRLYTRYGYHCLTFAVPFAVMLVRRSICAVAWYGGRGYCFEDLNAPFLDEDRPSTFAIPDINYARLMQHVSGMWIRDLHVDADSMRMVLVLDREGSSTLTMQLVSSLSWEVLQK